MSATGAKRMPAGKELAAIRRHIGYDAQTGRIWWMVPPATNRYLSGRSIRTTDSKGHVRITLQWKTYAAASVAWFLHYGEWPHFHVDHLNRNGTDNRIANLRRATASQNGFNQGLRKDSTTGFRGVSYHKRKEKFYARIRVSGTLLTLCTTETAEIAAHEYNKAAVKLHGAFASLNPVGVDPRANELEEAA